MKIVIITQDEPIYILPAIQRLLNLIPNSFTISGCVVLSPSPFGKREGLTKRAFKLLEIFGLKFFLYYASSFFFSRLFRPSLKKILSQHYVEEIRLDTAINHNSSLKKISRVQPDLLISIAGNEIFKKPLIELAPLGCLNLHTGLLPKYRGLMPTFWALKNNDKEIGVSVFYVDSGIDSGPIVVQKKVPVRNRVQSDLIKETKKVGIDCILEALTNIENNSVVIQDNDDSQSTYYGFPTPVDVAAFKKSGAKFF